MQAQLGDLKFCDLLGRLQHMSFFFFQAEDGIRDYKVTGVQTCALPISCLLAGCERSATTAAPLPANQISSVPTKVQPKLPTIKVWLGSQELVTEIAVSDQIGRASCRERV